MAADTKPVRVQLSRAKGWRMPENTVKVDRTTMFGNPFAHTKPEVAQRMFRAWLTGSMRSLPLIECNRVIIGPLGSYRRDMLREIPSLRGKNLACWCSGPHCHADVLLEIANADPPAPDQATSP